MIHHDAGAPLGSVTSGDGGEGVNRPMLRAMISVLNAHDATRLVVAKHYLHRRPPISHAFGITLTGAAAALVLLWALIDLKWGKNFVRELVWDGRAR